MATTAELNVAIARMERLLDSAVTQLDEGGRTVKRDLKVLSSRLDVLKAQRAALVVPVPVRVRRLFATSEKGL